MSRTLFFVSLLLTPLFALAQESQLPPAQYNGGDDNPPDPSDAGASGSQKDAFNLSKGALAAIIVVAVIVILGGSTLHRKPPSRTDHKLTKTQSAQQHSGGSQRSANGTSGHRFAEPRAASQAVATRTTSRIVRATEERVCVSTRRRRERRARRQGESRILRRACRCRARRRRLRRRSLA
jgi:hypothetical protein